MKNIYVARLVGAYIFAIGVSTFIISYLWAVTFQGYRAENRFIDIIIGTLIMMLKDIVKSIIEIHKHDENGPKNEPNAGPDREDH